MKGHLGKGHKSICAQMCTFLCHLHTALAYEAQSLITLSLRGWKHTAGPWEPRGPGAPLFPCMPRGPGLPGGPSMPDCPRAPSGPLLPGSPWLPT